MKTVFLVARILLGIMMVVFGLNKFMHFIPMDSPSEGPILTYMTALSSVHVLVIVGVLEVVAGALLLTNKFVALAALVLAPIMFNAALFHLTLDPANSVGALLGLLLTILVLISQKEKLRGVLSA